MLHTLSASGSAHHDCLEVRALEELLEVRDLGSGCDKTLTQTNSECGPKSRPKQFRGLQPTGDSVNKCLLALIS